MITVPTRTEKKVAKLPLIGGPLKRKMQLDRLTNKEFWAKSHKYPRANIPAPTINSINAWELHRLDVEAAHRARLKKIRLAIKARAKKMRAARRRK